MINNCLASAGIRILDSRDAHNRPRFHHVTPRSRYLSYNIDSSTESYSIGLDSRFLREFECCARDSVSFHFMKEPAAMRLVHYLSYYQ
jgi:hypothetical protein